MQTTMLTIKQTKCIHPINSYICTAVLGIGNWQKMTENLRI